MAEYRQYYVIRSLSHFSSRSGGGRLVTWHMIYICCVVGSYSLVIELSSGVVVGTYVLVVGGSLYIVGGCLVICWAYGTHSHNRPMTPAWESKMDITLRMQ
jgi:hypothetical protein